MKSIILILIVSLFLGCASTGIKIDSNKVGQIKSGVTTRAQVVALLGNPSTTVLTGDGKVLMNYIYSEARTKASSFIPVVGLISGGANMDTQILSIIINDKGLVEKYEFNDSKSEMKTGLI